MRNRHALVPADVALGVEAGIETGFGTSFDALLGAGASGAASWLVVKFIPARYCRAFMPGSAAPAGSGAALRISESPGFTWGCGNYVCPISNPISTAIYGRAGIVAEIDRNDAAGWRWFDARVKANQDAYLRWAALQPAFRWLMLSCHANLANHFLRNAFREAFSIDCVVFKPDQRNVHYTRMSDDWFCVSDWTPRRRLARGASRVLQQPRLAILVSEEFESADADIRRRALIGPRGPLPPNVALASDVRRAYSGGHVIELTT